MSAAAERSPAEGLPPAWERLERAVHGAAGALALWRSRALEAEGEVARLRAALEEVRREAAEGEVRALRAENALLRSRVSEARTRVSGLLARVAALESRR